ncbi:bifunctional serine/threonine-protein kinase/formylglycine-generating enzyme family protein [Gemmata sp.]|uniref:bifunctional serine/threonine-protein kinase/formylglycine-generating enzyme family protein n=1 Tax=Gemmata sp. TaxID=1914242 RepID=UPI003F6F1DAC
MNPEGAEDFDALPLSAVLRINARCDAFEALCRAGQRPRVADFLGDATGPERDSLHRHLTQVDGEYRATSAEEFTRRLASERLLPAGFNLDPAATASDLADGLVRSGALTAYQGRTLLNPHPHPLALDDYLILDRVASGGMGTVYRAVHRRMKREVAVKVFADGRGDDLERGRWFQREVEAAAKLTHPNVVTAYDAGEARGVAYLVSEFVDGADLHRLVTESGPLAPADAIRAVRDAAAGLAHAHECGVIHRDVKPSNLIRTRAGTVRVLDVGLAQLVRADRKADSYHTLVVGTPAFMAPEQAEAPGTVDARADVYSLGCTLFFLLTGRPPQDDTPRARHDADPELPPRLEGLFLRMTARLPADRPRSMGEVLAELDVISAPGRSPGRLRLVAASLAICLAVVAAVVLARPPVGSDTPPAPLPVPRPVAPKRAAVRDIPFDPAAYQAEWAAALGVPVEIEPVPGLKARLVPPGRFTMGSPPGTVEELLAGAPEEYVRERARGEAQRPAAIDSPFYIGTTEVTVGQFRQFAEAQTPPYRTVAERPDGVGYRLDAGLGWRVVSGATWRFAGEQPLTDDHPACNLCRDDCADVCRWLSIRSAGRYTCRLPTEAEWEFACRAGSAGLWSCGSDPGELGPLAWFAGTVDAGDARYRPVGRKAANGFGLFDMHGNLEECCTPTAPEAGAAFRGGNVRSPALGARSASREPASPTAPRGGLRVLFTPVTR